MNSRVGDLRVGQVLPERGQHVSLTGGHAHPRNHRSQHPQSDVTRPPGRPGRPRVNAVSALKDFDRPCASRRRASSAYSAVPSASTESSNIAMAEWLVGAFLRIAVRRAGAEEDERAGHLFQHEGEILRAGDRELGRLAPVRAEHRGDHLSNAEPGTRQRQRRRRRRRRSAAGRLARGTRAPLRAREPERHEQAEDDQGRLSRQLAATALQGRSQRGCHRYVRRWQARRARHRHEVPIEVHDAKTPSA